jgi:co-chaperonin GroES (HSP10)
MGEAARKKASFALVSPSGEDVAAGPRLSHPVTRDGTPIPFFPVGSRVVVERLPPETKIAGITIPDTAQALQQYGTVVAAGPQAQGILDDMGIGIGDTVCFGKHVGLNWEWNPDGKESYKDRHRVEIIRAEDILGGKELAEQMVDGRLGIALYCPDCGGMKDEEKHMTHNCTVEYRFFAQKGLK